ncbi:plasmid recombination protein [Lactococcus cremoris]|uniref:plasmid recombination protein n=1 Tax=Lactococcus lactis subsp. cremoris TaxID=1359 RepID=UPI00300E6744
MGIVPLKDGKLTAKTIFDRNCLRMIQNELPQAFQKAGFDIQRGKEKSEAQHLHPDTYKKQMKKVELEAEENIKDSVYEPLLERVSDLFEQLEEIGMTEENVPKSMELSKAFLDSDGYIDSDKLKKWDIFRFMRTAFQEISKFIGSIVQKIALRSSELDSKENTLKEREKSLGDKIERISREVEKFEGIKNNFDELIDEINPESQFNKYIDDALVALECYDKALKEQEWIEIEDYSSEDEMWRDVENEYIIDQNFFIHANTKMTWEDNPLRGVTKKGFIHEIKNQNGKIERGIPWTRLEIKTYLKQQIEERAKLKFDVSGIKENIAEERAKLLNNELNKGFGMRR